MNDLRHVCCFCGRKRIQRKMRKITVHYPTDNLIQGGFWACWFTNYSEGEQDCYKRYLSKRSTDFYYYGDKFASELGRAGEPPFISKK